MSRFTDQEYAAAASPEGLLARLKASANAWRVWQASGSGRDEALWQEASDALRIYIRDCREQATGQRDAQ